MRGFKGTDKNMCCRGFQFQIGKTYKINGKLEMCKNGFHFCETVKDVAKFYENDKKNRFFEIEAGKNTIQGKQKCVTTEITFIRELSELEINRNIYGVGNGDGNGDGNGYGYGYGYSDGYSYGNGDGYGNGNGYGYGNGYGNGNGYGYKSINKILVYK